MKTNNELMVFIETSKSTVICVSVKKNGAANVYELNPLLGTCSCPDHHRNNWPCKHLKALGDLA
jgi:uncharacterized Zn finger protein